MCEIDLRCWSCAACGAGGRRRGEGQRGEVVLGCVVAGAAKREEGGKKDGDELEEEGETDRGGACLSVGVGQLANRYGEFFEESNTDLSQLYFSTASIMQYFGKVHTHTHIQDDARSPRHTQRRPTTRTQGCGPLSLRARHALGLRGGVGCWAQVSENLAFMNSDGPKERLQAAGSQGSAPARALA
eukprot:3544819-Rhodomonas_salina.1